MTRINCVPVTELCLQHALAEYHELPRVFGLAKRAYARGTIPKPAVYTLGKGHITFFYNKLLYLDHRHLALVTALKWRGVKINHEAPPDAADIPAWYNDWEPTPEAMALNRERIKQSLARMEAAGRPGKFAT